MPRSKTLVIGSCNVDFFIQLAKLPVVGESVSDGQFMQAFDGKGANQAVPAARAGGDGRGRSVHHLHRS
jgi:ribokinase